MKFISAAIRSLPMLTIASCTLVCGKISLAHNVDVYLHVVCEYADPIYVEFVTAYIPDEREWDSPPIRRREGKKK